MPSISAPHAYPYAGAQRSAAPLRALQLTRPHARTLVPVRASAGDMPSSTVTSYGAPDQPGRVGTVSTSTAQAPAPGPSSSPMDGASGDSSPSYSASGETVLEDACSFLSAELRQLFTTGVRAGVLCLPKASATGGLAACVTLSVAKSMHVLFLESAKQPAPLRAARPGLSVADRSAPSLGCSEQQWRLLQSAFASAKKRILPSSLSCSRAQVYASFGGAEGGCIITRSFSGP